MAIDKITTPAVTDDAVTLAKMAPGTDGNIISYDASGNPVAVATGSAGQILTSAGAGAPPTFATAAAAGITVANQWRYTGGESLSAGSTRELINNLEEVDSGGQGKIGTSMSESSGVFTFPSTGIYRVEFNASYYSSGSSRYIIQKINVTTNNSSFNAVGESYSSIKNVSSSTYQSGHVQSLIDVTDTSNVKVKFAVLAHDSCTLQGSTTVNRTYVTFTRLGDT